MVAILVVHLSVLQDGIGVDSFDEGRRPRQPSENPHAPAWVESEAAGTARREAMSWRADRRPVAGPWRRTQEGRSSTCSRRRIDRFPRAPTGRTRRNSPSCRTPATDPSNSRREIDRVGSKGDYLKQKMRDKLIEHKHFIDEHGEDLPEIRNWKWSAGS
jgi:hypothetical protein